MREMTPRERVLTALAHEEPDQVPKTAGFTRAAGKAHPFKGGMKGGLQVLDILQVSNSYGIM